MARVRLRAGILAAGLLVATLLLSSDAGALPRARYRIRSWSIARGVRFLRIVDTRGPNHIRLVRVDPAARATIDVGLPGGDILGFRRTSVVARRRRALAAINGTFMLETGRPISILAEDGELETTPLTRGPAFSLAADESRFFLGRPRLSIVARSPHSVADIEKWNESTLRQGELAGYTPSGGGRYRPPGSACSVRLRRVEAMHWGPKQTCVEQGYLVERVLCARARLGRHGGVVLSTRRRGAPAGFVSSLERRDPLTIGWSVGWRRTLDVMGGNPVLLSKGRVVAPARCASYFCNRNPRTGIGVTARGRVLLMTVDGRQPGRSVGMRLNVFARTLRRFGAVDALNLDGGGSTTMVVRGRVVNRPSDPSGERPASSAILVLPRRDRGEVLRSAADGLPGPSLPSRAAGERRAVLSDPGSTGGLLDALARGAIGERAALPAGLRRVVRAYRRTMHRR